jgi:hypothetical protein
MRLCGFDVGLDKPLFVLEGAHAEGGAGSIGVEPMDATPESGAEGLHHRRWRS